METDGFYRKSFNQDQDEQLFEHGVCWVHCKRYFCVLLNYATTKDDEPIKAFVKAHWEQDIVDPGGLQIKSPVPFRGVTTSQPDAKRTAHLTWWH